MMYIDGKIKKYLSDLAARTPAPGGGSAAALSAAMSAALLEMACRYTLGKDKYKNIARRMSALLTKTRASQARLERLLDLDVAAYRSKDLKKSIEVPAEVARLSYELALAADEVRRKGNVFLKTDAALAVTLAAAGFIAALSYVEVNIRWAKAAPALAGVKKLSKDLRKKLNKIRSIRQQAEASLGTSSGR